MIKFENTEVVGLEHAIRGMRNSWDSWDKSDSIYVDYDVFSEIFKVGENDLELMKKLAKAGTDHRKYLRMITVYVDITAPRYWWTEFDTYKVGTVANSCSTMHTIEKKEFTIDDFSHEHLSSEIFAETSEGDYSFDYVMDVIITALNIARDMYLKTKDKKYWWQMIQLLPQSYNQKRTVMLNYEVLANIVKPGSRLHHKLDEWNIDYDGSFCQWVKTLPYADELIF